MSFVCFIRSAKFGVSDLFFLSRFQNPIEKGLLRTNEGVLIPLSRKTKSNIMKKGLLRTICNSEVYSVAALLAFARAIEIA